MLHPSPRAAPSPALPPCFAFVEPHAASEPAGLVWLAHLPPACGIVIRKGARAEHVAGLGRFAAAARGRVLLLGSNPHLAYRLGAGVHMAEREQRRCLFVGGKRRGLLVSAAAHGVRSLARARAWGADCAFLSPLFASPGHAPPLGLVRFLRLARARTALPIYALGGMDGARWQRLRPATSGANVAGFAAMRAFA